MISSFSFCRIRRHPASVIRSAFCLATLVFAASIANAQSDTAPAKGGKPVDESLSVPLFNGQSLDDWNGDHTVFRVEDKAIVGGQLQEKIPHNFFLEHSEEFDDFELRLQFKLIGPSTNAGIQIRSKRIPNHHEMIGYQADLGQKYWGCLYDESRRRKVLQAPDPEKLAAVLKKNDWNDYRILCEGPRIRLFINGMKTVDYEEKDPKIPLMGKIALQIHGGPAGEAWYRKIRIRRIAK